MPDPLSDDGALLGGRALSRPSGWGAGAASLALAGRQKADEWSALLAEPMEQVLASGRWLAASWPTVLAGAALVGAALVAVALYRRARRRREERFGAFFAAAPEALLLLDDGRRVLEANEAACELTGREASSLQGRRMDDLLEAAGTQTLQAAFETVEQSWHGKAPGEETDATDDAEKTAPARCDARFERPDGSMREVRLRLRALRLGGRRRTAAALQDMTSVNEEQAFFRGFHRRTVEDLPVELAVLDPSGTYLYANPPACPDGISPQWLQGKTDFDLCRRLGLHPEVALRRRSHRRRAVQSGRRVQFQEVLSRRDGPARHVERFYTPVEDEASEIHAVVTYALDRTEEHRREQTLQKARRASEDYEEMKSTLLRNLSHEFRTPLTSILSASEVLREEVQRDQRDFVEIVHHNGRRLLRTLNAMLNLAVTQAGDLNQQPHVVSLNRVADAIIEEMEGSAQEKGLFLRKQALSAEAHVRVDPTNLHRVFRSIIGNAVKFTEEGGIVVEVDVRGAQARLRVIDTGVGIDEAYLPQLFESFGQEDGSTTRAFDGVGVGLAVARRLLAVMGGTVEVDSEKDEGSVFTVTLPLAFRNADGEPPRVLVVEQQAEQEKMLRHYLDAQANLTVVRAFEEAVEAAHSQRFAAVFVSSDLIGPEDAMGDFVNRFRAADRNEDTPLVAIDESALPGAAEQFEADGYDGYVARPLRRAALLDALGDALSAGHFEAPARGDSRPEGRQAEREVPVASARMRRTRA